MCVRVWLAARALYVMKWSENEMEWTETSCQYYLLSFAELAFPLFPVSYKCEQMCQIVQHLKVQLVLSLPLQSTQVQFHLLSMYFCIYKLRLKWEKWRMSQQNEQKKRQVCTIYSMLSFSSSFFSCRCESKRNGKYKFPIRSLHHFLLLLRRKKSSFLFSHSHWKKLHSNSN